MSHTFPFHQVSDDNKTWLNEMSMTDGNHDGEFDRRSTFGAFNLPTRYVRIVMGKGHKDCFFNRYHFGIRSVGITGYPSQKRASDQEEIPLPPEVRSDCSMI